MKVNHSVGLFTSLKCVYCYRHFKDKKQLRYHLQAEHTPKIIECTFPSCRRLFSTKPFLQHHLKTHSEKRYACSICKKEFKVKSYMEKHKATHEDIRPYKCSDCDKTYMSVSHVNGHWKRTHSLTTNYLCSICGKTFKNKLDLTYHENAHQGWKPFKCELCDYSTSYKPSLINHTKKHSSSRKKADTKIKSIRPETERTNKKIPHYTKIESELRPYKCLDCDSTYKTAVRANEHWRRYHMVRTEFRCPFCHTVFTNEKAFNIHKTHHEEQQLYKCDVCSYQTAFRIGFFTHQKTHSKLAKQSGQAARCVKNITNANTSFPQKSNGKKFVEEISMYEGVTNSVFDNCNESPKILNEELIPLMNDCEKIAEDFDSSQIKWTLSDEDTSVKEKPRSRLKEHSFFSYVKMEGDDYVWDEDECKQLSEGLILEQAFVAASGLDLDVDETLRAPNWTSLPFQETPSNLEASNHFSSPLIGKRSDPKITLNCTAIDNVIEENQFHFEI